MTAVLRTAWGGGKERGLRVTGGIQQEGLRLYVFVRIRPYMAGPVRSCHRVKLRKGANTFRALKLVLLMIESRLCKV